MLAAWRAEIESEPIPELVDLDTAVAAVVAGMKADAAGTRRRRADRLRHLAPLAAAAAIIVATISGVGLGSQGAMPGDTLWPIQKIVDPERAGSVEAKIAIEGRLQIVRVALATGDTETAARELEAIRTEIPAVRGEEGQPQLLQEQEFLTLKLAESTARHARGPDAHRRSSDPDAPLDHGHRPRRRRRRPRPPIRRSWWSRRATRRCRSRWVRTRVPPVRRWFRRPRVGVGFGGADGSRLGLFRAGGHQGADRVGAGEHGGRRGRDHRARPVRRRPAGVRGRRERAGVRRCAGRRSRARTPRPPVPRARASTPRGRRPPAELPERQRPPPFEGRGPLPCRGWPVSRRRAPRPRSRGSTPS